MVWIVMTKEDAGACEPKVWIITYDRSNRQEEKYSLVLYVLSDATQLSSSWFDI